MPKLLSHRWEAPSRETEVATAATALATLPLMLVLAPRLAQPARS